MTIFEVMIMGHLIGDWILQTEWQATNKATSWGALMAHILIYHVVMFALLYFSFDFSLWSLAVAVLFLALTHALMDRQKIMNRLMHALRVRVQRDDQKWLSIAFDQAVHLLLMGAATAFLTHLPRL